MPQLSSGQTASLVLDPGQSYTISTTGVATVKGIYGAPATTTTLNSNFAVFGPYGVPAKLDIACTSGVASYTLDQYEGDVVRSKTNPFTGERALIGPNGVPFAPTSLYGKLLLSKRGAEGKTPFDITASTTQPLVSSVTLNQATFAAPATYNFYDAGGFTRFHTIGIPHGDTGLMAGNSGGSISTQNPSGPTGGGYGGMAQAQNQHDYAVRFRVTCSACQINVNSLGNSSNFFPVWVRGIDGVWIPVAPTPANITSGSGNIQINFAARGTYDVCVGFKQALGFKGVSVSEDDTLHILTTPPLPIVMFGDSYTFGQVSPQVTGSNTLNGALSWVGGLNVMAHGAPGTGYINPAGNSFPMTFLGRLQYVAAIVNFSKAPLILIPAGYNDVTLSPTAAAQEAACRIVFDYLLANTGACIIATGAQPGIRNNSAATQVVDLGIANAVNSTGSSRIAFMPLAGAVPRYGAGTRDTAHTTGLIAGPSRYLIGDDSVHLSPTITASPNIPANMNFMSGVEDMARKLLDGMLTISQERGW